MVSAVDLLGNASKLPDADRVSAADCTAGSPGLLAGVDLQAPTITPSPASPKENDEEMRDVRADETLVTSLPGPLRGLTETAGALPVIRLSALVVVLALAKGCGDGPAAPPTPDASRPTTVVVTPATVELTAFDETVQLTAEVRDQNGGLVVGAAVRWSTSDPSVASVNASGLVTAVGEGVATITARAGSGEGTAEVRVAGPERAALEEFYEATDGPNWVNSENWLTDAPLGEWFGVETDADGRVVELDLAGRWESETRTVVIHGLSGHDPVLDSAGSRS